METNDILTALFGADPAEQPDRLADWLGVDCSNREAHALLAECITEAARFDYEAHAPDRSEAAFTFCWVTGLIRDDTGRFPDLSITYGYDRTVRLFTFEEIDLVKAAKGLGRRNVERWGGMGRLAARAVAEVVQRVMLARVLATSGYKFDFDQPVIPWADALVHPVAALAATSDEGGHVSWARSSNRAG